MSSAATGGHVARMTRNRAGDFRYPLLASQLKTMRFEQGVSMRKDYPQISLTSGCGNSQKFRIVGVSLGFFEDVEQSSELI